MTNREAAIEWFSMLKKKFVKTEYEGYLDLAISALEKQEQERWRTTAEKEPDVNCLACDKFGQIFIPQCGIINITAGNKRKSFDCPADFDVSDINAFFKGKEVGNGMRILPKEILAWRPLPEPYQEEEA